MISDYGGHRFWLVAAMLVELNYISNNERERDHAMESKNNFEFSIDNSIPVTEKRCYTVEDLQIILGISRGTVYKLLEQKEFRWIKIGSVYRISKKSFNEWLDNKL